MTPTDRSDDVLYGVPAIAEAFNWKQRQVHHLKEAHGLPTFKIGKTVCARRGAITAWLAEREAAARPDTVRTPSDGAPADPERRGG